MGGELRLARRCARAWGFLFLVGFPFCSSRGGAGEALISSNATVVLFAGLAGDLESEKTYRDQLQILVDTFTNAPAPPQRIFVLWESPETLSAGATVEVIKAGRKEFLTLGKSLAGQTNPLVIIAWGHGGMQGRTPVFHVRGERITPEDFKTFAAQMPAAESRWVMMFRASGRFARELSGQKRRIISSEKDALFSSDPIGMTLLTKILYGHVAISFQSLAEQLGTVTAAWYSERNLARTEEPTLWSETDAPRLLVPAEKDEALASVPSSKAIEPAPAPKTERPPEVIASLPAAWKEIKRIEAQEYPNADGVVLRRRVNYTLGASPAIAATHEEYIQVLTAEGKELGDFDISYSPPQEQIAFQDCEVLRPDGEILRVEADNIREAGEDSVADYRQARRKFFSLPGVVPGAVLHVRYQSEWKAFPMPYILLQIPLASEIPVLDSAVQVSVAGDSAVHFAFEHFEAVDPVIKQTAYGNTYSWQFRNLPAQEHEALAPPHLRPALLISTFPDWSAFAGWYGRITKLADVVTPQITAKAAELTREAKSDREKALAIYNYVTSLRYVAVPLGVNSFRPHAAANVLQNQFGDCKDKANLFNALLRSLDVDAHLVLVPRFAQAHDSIPGLAFNHAISRVTFGQETLWVDTTDEACRFGMLPPGDPGRKVLVIDGQSTSLTQLPPPTPEQHQLKLRARVTCSGSTEAMPTTLHVETTGFPDYELRTGAREMKPTKNLPLLAKNFRPASGTFALEEQTFTPVSDLGDDFTWKAEGACFGIFSESAGKCWLRAPFWLPKEWDLALNKRKTPLFLNQGYPLILDEELEFSLGEKAPRDLVLPVGCENNQSPLRWKIHWLKQGERLLMARMKLELVSGELTTAETLAFQKQLGALLAAVAREADFIDPVISNQ